MKTTETLLLLLTACSSPTAPPTPDAGRTSHCEGNAVIICSDGVEVLSAACDGPDGCTEPQAGSFECDQRPRIGEECSVTQLLNQLQWCASSWPDVIVQCQAVTGQAPRWAPVVTCPAASVCVVEADGARCD